MELWERSFFLLRRKNEEKKVVIAFKNGYDEKKNVKKYVIPDECLYVCENADNIESILVLCSLRTIQTLSLSIYIAPILIE